MFLSLFLLAVTLSFDSLGVGIAYGIQNIQITKYSKLVLFIVSFVTVLLSTFAGLIVFQVLPIKFVHLTRCSSSLIYWSLDNISKFHFNY